MTEKDEGGARHRANYWLELGVWRATCRVCGHHVDDPLRRRAASLFRNHIRDVSEAKANQRPSADRRDMGISSAQS